MDVKSSKLRIQVTKNSRIMAIDPGVTCGFASTGPELSDKAVSQKKFFVHDGFLQTIIEFYPDILVMEKFVMTHRDKTDFTAIEYIGLGRWYAQRRRIPFVLQTPGLGKGYFTNDKLKRLGVYAAGKPHAMDALRHLFQFMMRSEIFDLNLLR